MLPIIIENLNRQSKGMQLLLMLMQEEFSLLMSREPRDVTRIEFSIQELMGQLMAERTSLKNLLGGQRLVNYLEKVPAKHPRNAERVEKVREQLAAIEEQEQTLARQAEKNSTLVLALMDQSEKLLVHLHGQLRPEKMDSYSNRGTYSSDRPQAALITGRL